MLGETFGDVTCLSGVEKSELLKISIEKSSSISNDKESSDDEISSNYQNPIERENDSSALVTEKKTHWKRKQSIRFRTINRVHRYSMKFFKHLQKSIWNLNPFKIQVPSKHHLNLNEVHRHRQKLRQWSKRIHLLSHQLPSIFFQHLQKLWSVNFV